VELAWEWPPFDNPLPGGRSLAPTLSRLARGGVPSGERRVKDAYSHLSRISIGRSDGRTTSLLAGASQRGQSATSYQCGDYSTASVLVNLEGNDSQAIPSPSPSRRNGSPGWASRQACACAWVTKSEQSQSDAAHGPQGSPSAFWNDCLNKRLCQAVREHRVLEGMGDQAADRAAAGIRGEAWWLRKARRFRHL